MAKFRWFNGNQGFYGFDRFAAYVQSAADSTGMVLDYDATNVALDPEVYAARIVFSYTNARSYTIEDGPNAGQQQVTGGTLSAIRYYDAANLLLLEVTRIGAALPVFLATLARGDGFAAWHLVTRGSNILTGSADASTLDHAGTGDVIDTGAAHDQVAAANGDDFIQDRGGADNYNGGRGFDTLSYDGWFFTPYAITAGIRCDLLTGSILGPDGATDSVIAIEGVSGTFLADVIYGSSVANNFAGYAGSDRFDGRGGFDIVTYGRDASQGGTDGIRVNLAAGTVRDGFGYTDYLISIEGAEGTAQRDIMRDSVYDNSFFGAGGDDVLKLGAGNDSVRGGTGTDAFQFRGTSFGDDTIEDFTPVDGDSISIEQVTDFAQLSLTNFTIAGKPAVFVQCSSGSLTLLGVTTLDLDPMDFGF